MAFNLPDIGEENWGDEVIETLEYLRDTAEAALDGLGSKAETTVIAALEDAIAAVENDLEGKADASDVVPTTRLINGNPLSSDVTLTANSVGAVPTARTVAGQALSGDVTATALTAALDAATDAAKGTVELATTTETTTGTDTTRAVTPAGVAAAQANTPIVVQWTGSAWPTYSTDSSRVRLFFSLSDPAATAPTYYNANDVWFYGEA